MKKHQNKHRMNLRISVKRFGQNDEAMDLQSRDSRPTKRGDAEIYERGNENDWRILIGNIGTFPNEGTGQGKLKMDVLKHLCTSSDADMILLNEHNMNLHNTVQEKRPNSIMSKWKQNSIGHFVQFEEEKDRRAFNRETKEYGGTGIMTNGRATAHRIDYGEDNRKMGRWNWCTVKGKNEKKTTIISVYRPESHQSIYSRQLAKLRRTGKTEISAEKAWFDDLYELVQSKKNDGNEIIIAGDFNNDLNDIRSKVNKHMEKMGMKEILITRYGKGPPTHQRGSKTIDGIYATSGIKVIQGGYVEEFDSPGDHRFLWVDILQQEIIGEPQESKPPPVSRRATSKIPSVKAKFGEVLEDHVNEHNLYSKINQVYDKAVANKALTEEESQMYEKVEEQIKRGVKRADTLCRKVRRGAIPFSDKAQQIRGEVEIKKLILRRILLRGKCNRPKSSKVKRLSKKYKYKGPMSFQNKEAAIESLQQSYKAYNEFRPKAHEFRDSYLGRIAMELEDKDGTSAEIHFKQLRQQERQKEQARRVKFSEGRAVRSGVKKVDIRTENGTLKTVHDKEEIEQAIIKANTEKRQQANNTPLRQEPLQSLLGEQMDFETWDKVLRGVIPLPEEGVEEGTRLWYDYITKNNDIEPMDITWTTEEYFDSWSKMPETKSCLPGVHTVHLKCIDPKSNSADVMSKLALIPLLSGYTPKSWKTGIDSMIPKKAEGEHRPEKLRLILLMCARFNHNNKLIGKKMMEYGEKNGTLAEEQYGSRKAKSAIEHALNKRLILDVARQTKKECIYIANDAKSCYDRILMMVAYFAMVKNGIDPLVAKSCIAGILDMEMRIRTTHGDSEVTYGGEKWLKVPHGCGQGNGYGPAIWACISSPLLIILKKKGHGINITSPITRSIFRFSAISFVDDTDTIEMAKEGETWEELFNRTKQGLDLWESLLRTTGGALEPTKSDWVKIRHIWKDGKTTLDNEKEERPLTVRNPAGEQEELQQKAANEARETLGVWQTPNGTEDIQVEVLQGKIDKWRNNINRSTINKRNARWAAKTTIGKTIRYPLAATTMTEKQCQKIEKNFTNSVYGKIGVVRTASTKLGAAPRSLGGFGLNSNIHENQTIDHVSMLMKHGHKATTTGKLIRTSAESLSIESGLPRDPLSLNTKEITWTTDNTWIQHSISSMDNYELKIKSGLKGLQTWASHDGYIMHEAKHFLKTPKELSRFNKVRMYMRATTLSDLLTADGKKISQDAYDASQNRKSVTPSANAYEWPVIPEPSRTEKKIWQTTIKLIMGVTRTTLEVEQDTGFAWDVSSSENSGWVVTNDNSILYQKMENKTWSEWRRIERRTRNPTYMRTEEVTRNLPQCIKPCTVSIHHDEASVTHIGTFEILEAEEGYAHETGWILPRIAGNNEEEQNFIDSIREKKGQIVSDGSSKDGRSTSAFVVLPSKIINGSNTVPGEPKDQHSYRGELAGILASICYTNKICENHRVRNGACTMYCDNKGALCAAFGWKEPNPRWSSYDLVCLIRFHLARSPITWKGQHIKGHQDSKHSYEDLDIIAQGNVDADQYAAEEMNLERDLDTRPIIGAPWILEYDGRKISGDIEKRIRHLIHERTMQDYWRKKFDLTEDQQRHISWEAFLKTNQLNDEWIQIWMAKYNSRIGSVRKNLLRRNHATDETCPCCGDIEDTDHILKCPNTEINEVYNEKMNEIKQWLEDTSTIEMAKGLKAVSDAFRNNTTLDLTTCTDRMVRAAAEQQFQLGQRAFIGGWWSGRWINLQAIHYRETGKRNKPMLWMARTIKKFQEMVRDIWFERNDQLHHKENSEHNKRKNEELNDRVTNIFQRLGRLAPNDRMLLPDERIFFAKKEANIKKRKIRSKRRWVNDADDILDIYELRTKKHNSITDYLIYASKEYG